MAFRFSLESVLRYRESLEKVEEIALHKIVQEIAGTTLQLQKIEDEQQLLRDQRERDLAQGLPAAYLQDLSLQELQLLTGAEKIRTRLLELESNRVQQLAIYQQAQQAREILSEVRKQKHESYLVELRRQEQKGLDELFLARLQSDK
jgi:flagellar export protein FliJ